MLPILVSLTLAACSSAAVKIEEIDANEPSPQSPEDTSGLLEDDSSAADTDSTSPRDEERDEGNDAQPCDSILDSDGSGLTDHFRTWIAQQGYTIDFNRPDINGGSFGGLVNETDCVVTEPVIFVHGNGDKALGGFGGWDAVRQSFRDHGHRSSELYATTYGPADPNQSASYSHSQEYVQHVRGFIQAVLEYTGAEKVDVIGHSLGVTIARMAIIGGQMPAADGSQYDLGAPLTAHIDSFVGIAGANWGMASCVTPLVPVCSTETGYYPGWWNGFQVQDLSTALATINQSTGREGQHIYSIWSSVDAVIGTGCVVWDHNTCRVPGDHGDLHLFLDHLSIRSLTGEAQIQMVVEHRLPQ